MASASVSPMRHAGLLLVLALYACAPVQQTAQGPSQPMRPAQPMAEPAPAPQKPTAAVAPSQITIPFKSAAIVPIRTEAENADIARVLNDLLLAELTILLQGKVRIMGQSDIETMLGFERTKDELGCDSTSCMTELAGALGVDSLVAPTLGKLGSKYVMTLSWIAQRDGMPFRRHVERLGSDVDKFDIAMQRAVRGLLGMTPATPSQAQAPSLPNGTYKGFFAESSGPVAITTVFSSQGGTLSANYTYRNSGGQISGCQGTGLVFRCQWTEASYRGQLTFTFAADHSSFDGTWQYTGRSGGGTWNGRRAN